MRTPDAVSVAGLTALVIAGLIPGVASADGMTAVGALFDVVFIAVIALVVGGFYGGIALALWAARRSWRDKPPSSGRRMLALFIIVSSLLSLAVTLSLARSLLAGQSRDAILFYSPAVLIPAAAMLALADGGRRVLRDDAAAVQRARGLPPPGA